MPEGGIDGIVRLSRIQWLRMRMKLKQSIGRGVVALMRQLWGERPFLYLAYHHKRALRRRVEEKLRRLLRRDIGNVIRSRFEDTHRIEECTVSGVPYERFPFLENLSMPEILALTESDRACIHPWFFLENQITH